MDCSRLTPRTSRIMRTGPSAPQPSPWRLSSPRYEPGSWYGLCAAESPPPTNRVRTRHRIRGHGAVTRARRAFVEHELPAIGRVPAAARAVACTYHEWGSYLRGSWSCRGHREEGCAGRGPRDGEGCGTLARNMEPRGPGARERVAHRATRPQSAGAAAARTTPGFEAVPYGHLHDPQPGVMRGEPGGRGTALRARFMPVAPSSALCAPRSTIASILVGNR